MERQNITSNFVFTGKGSNSGRNILDNTSLQITIYLNYTNQVQKYFEEDEISIHMCMYTNTYHKLRVSALE